MLDSQVGHVDHIAAANLAREFCLDLDGEQMVSMARHLAEHRISTLDLAVSRIQAKISATIQGIVGVGRSHQSIEWSDGCRSAEAAILAITSDVLLEIRPRERRSRGQILRTMLGKARKSAEADRLYRVIRSTNNGPER